MHLSHQIASIVINELHTVLAAISQKLHCGVDVPFIGHIWEKYITQGTQDFSFISLAALPGALAFTVSYKAHFNGREPFDNDDVRALIKAPTPTDYILKWKECKDCRSAEVYPIEKRFHALTWLFASHRIAMGSILAITEPIQNIVRYVIPFKPVFQFLHQMASFPFQDPRKPRYLAVETWIYGLIPLVFLSASNQHKAGTLEMVIRVPHAALSVVEFASAYKTDLSLRQRVNPLSALAWHWRLKGLSDIVHAMPQLPGMLKITSYETNPRMIGTLLDIARLEMDITMGWKF
jgi:hypothetical protein